MRPYKMAVRQWLGFAITDNAMVAVFRTVLATCAPEYRRYCCAWWTTD